MPLYEYKCPACKHYQVERKPVSERNRLTLCENCGSVTKKLISMPNVITDGDFVLTGKVDRRLGGGPIEGRKDYRKRVREKGFRELSSRELKDLRDDDSERKVSTVDF
ncbi:hypothetical protein ES703_54804 [subsurface metagenome]